MIRSTLRGLAAATVLLVAVSSTADAQSRFGLTAGIAMPMGDFGDAVGLGVQVGGHFQMPLGETLHLRFNGDFSNYGGDAAGIDNVRLLGAVANIVLPIKTSSELKPYVYGGLGMYQWTVNGTGGGSFDETDLAFNVGVGYDFKLGNSNLFTELRFLSIQSEGSATNTMPIVIGLRF
jgi:hypothetical protein